MASGSGFAGLLSNPLKLLHLRLATRPDLEFFVRILQLFHLLNFGIAERITYPQRRLTKLGLGKTPGSFGLADWVVTLQGILRLLRRSDTHSQCSDLHT